MTRYLTPLALGFALLGAGCQSVDVRSRQHAALFNQLPPADQQRLLAREVLIGDTPEMVEIALGRPDREDAITVSNGTIRRTWAYLDKRYMKEGSQITRIDERRNTAEIADIYRVFTVLRREVVFMDERVVHVRDPQREAQALAALK